jgi:RHH-type proline utilization regulon transcriptional repressor/proline dehydrogenase/delta 1-pyrroline-5-carboxylate dehydrogenase
LATDVGPVITQEARDGIEAHIEAMRCRGLPIHRVTLTQACAHGTFVAPTIIELTRLAELEREVFGPVLHVLRYRRDALDGLMAEINAAGYGLTFGVHTRIDETIAKVTTQAKAGNIYVNRNLIGAVVGVQPFGGHGLSGTGPKAGGPLYLRRLLRVSPPETGLVSKRPPPSAQMWADWLARNGLDKAAARFAGLLEVTPFAVEQELPGPVGERNLYCTEARGGVLCVAEDQDELLHQIGAAIATGNRAYIAPGALPAPPGSMSGWIIETTDPHQEDVSAVLFSGTGGAAQALCQAVADRDGHIVPVHVAQPNGHYPLEWLIQERSISTNTTAAGGNANLMMIG